MNEMADSKEFDFVNVANFRAFVNQIKNEKTATKLILNKLRPIT